MPNFERKLRNILREWEVDNKITVIDIHRSTSSELKNAYQKLGPGVIDDLRALADSYDLNEVERKLFLDTALRDVGHRRRYISDQIADLDQQEQIEEFKGALNEKVEDPEVRQELIDLLAKFSEDQQKVALENRAADLAAIREEEKHAAEMRERKYLLWKSLLERESVAVLVGAVLLTLLTLSLVAAMFLHIATPEIFSSAFLLVLGFFFGQAAGATGRKGD